MQKYESKIILNNYDFIIYKLNIKQLLKFLIIYLIAMHQLLTWYIWRHNTLSAYIGILFVRINFRKANCVICKT